MAPTEVASKSSSLDVLETAEHKPRQSPSVDLPARPHTRPKWRFHPAKSAFRHFAQDWQRLNRTCHDHPLLDSIWITSLLRHFALPDVQLGIYEDQETFCATLLTAKAPGIWETFQPSQAPLGLVLSTATQDSSLLNALIRHLPGFVFQLSILHQDPCYTAWPRDLADKRFEFLNYIETPRVSVNTTFDEYWNSRGSNLRHNLARQRRKLQASGHELRLKVVVDPAEMAPCVRDFGLIESAGWKSACGTAISPFNAQGQFYAEVLTKFAEQGEAVVFQLLMDGRLVSSDLCIVRNGMLIVLKTTYDESIERLSPGLLLRESEMKYIFECGQFNVVEFYGRVLEYHRKFTSELRTMFHINFFRSSALAAGKRWLFRRS